MEERHRIEIDNQRQALHRVININTRLSSKQDQKLKKIMYKIIEDPF